jgi:hypothetical protein
MLALASKASRQSDFRDALLHDTRSLDPRVMRRLPASGSTAEGVLTEMRSVGAKGRAYCISAVLDANDRELDLLEALRLVVGRSSDSLVLAIGAPVAFYENHEGEQAVLHRKT